jgi:hypothetical protein
MNMSEYIKNRDDAQSLVLIGTTSVGSVIMRVLNEKAERVALQIRRDPVRVSNGSLKDDIAYHLGMEAGVRWLASLIEEARKMLASADTENGEQRS